MNEPLTMSTTPFDHEWLPKFQAALPDSPRAKKLSSLIDDFLKNKETDIHTFDEIASCFREWLGQNTFKLVEEIKL